MLPISKPAATVILTIVIIVAGFFFLLRGCLSKYDERSALPQVLYFENKEKQVIFSIVKYEKTTSYSRNGGMVRKTVSATYYIQNNDAKTAEKIEDQKIKHHSDIKNFPVRVLGASANNAWLFMGEPMAFDAFTLDKKADIKMLEEKNPGSKGKFPTESRYYSFNHLDGNIYFTALDGSPWKIDTKSLIVSNVEEGASISPNEKELKKIDQQLKLTQLELDSLMENKLRKPGRQLQAKEITLAQFQQASKEFNEQRSDLYKVTDSLRRIKLKLEKDKLTGEDIKRKIAALTEPMSGINFSQMKTNMDTANNKWVGLLNKEEFEKLPERIYLRSVYDEKARRQLFSSIYTTDRYSEPVIDKINAKNFSTAFYLDGGFLLNRETSLPIRLNNTDFLIVYKNQIGNDGKIQLSRINENGKQLWTFDTNLKSWGSYLFTGSRLVITGTNNPELSGSDANLLICVDLEKGTAVTYDYFNDK